MAAPRADVIVLGAGPTGLVLASELALAGVRCLVLERRDGLRPDSRAACLHARSMEMLDLRGQASVFAAAGLPVPSFPLGPRGAVIGFGRLDSDFPYLLDMPQSQIERLLAARAAELGAEFRWSSEAVGLEQDDDEVRVTLADGRIERASYVVGCDGVRSFARRSLNMPFPGAPNPGSVILADLHLDGLPMTDAYGDLSENGMLLVFPFRDGSCRLVLYDYARADLPVTEPVIIDEVRSSLARIAGPDFSPRDMYWSRRYRSESRQVPAYRAGRILLAGDAAHTHSPAGAQGMNTGLQDALNLGWKLGAAVSGWAPGWLLDSYHDERHPVGAAVLALTGRQFKLNTARTRWQRARRWVAHRGIAPLPPVQAWLAGTYSGIAIRYPPLSPAASLGGSSGAAGGSPGGAGAALGGAAGQQGGGGAQQGGGGAQQGGAAGQQGGAGIPAGVKSAHPLAGARLPRGLLTLADGSSARLYDLFRDGRFVLLESAVGEAGEPGEASPARPPGLARPPGPPGPAGEASRASPAGLAGDGPAARVRLVCYRVCAGARLPRAVLVRPDGYVAWASDERGSTRAEERRAALTAWCGAG